jgi:hypothetical protein
VLSLPPERSGAIAARSSQYQLEPQLPDKPVRAFKDSRGSMRQSRTDPLTSPTPRAALPWLPLRGFGGRHFCLTKCASAAGHRPPAAQHLHYLWYISPSATC